VTAARLIGLLPRPCAARPVPEALKIVDTLRQAPGVNYVIFFIVFIVFMVWSGWLSAGT
jgi:hypothetical protein